MFDKAIATIMFQKTKRSIQWILPNKNYFVYNQQKYSGVHLIADFWNGKVTENPKELKKILIGAVKASDSTPLEVAIHKFSPHGITGVVLLAESHIAVHHWPEFNYTAIDIYTCGDKANPAKALEYFKNEFQPKKIKVKTLKRGRIQ